MYNLDDVSSSNNKVLNYWVNNNLKDCCNSNVKKSNNQKQNINFRKKTNVKKNKTVKNKKK